MDKQFVKLSTLVNDTFTVEGVGAYLYKKWDPAQSKMLTSPSWEEGYRKIYPVTTDKGTLDLGAGQLGNLLEAVFHHGEANLIGVTFSVKSNGKTGMDIRYFFNAVRQNDPEPQQIDINDIPPEFM